MSNIKACFSSKTDDWATPQDFFDKLNQEFNFNLDPCADDLNHKCEHYFTKEQDGLKQDWGGMLFSVIPLTVKRFLNGYNIHTNKVKNQVQS